MLRKEGFRVKTASAKKNQVIRLLDMVLMVFNNRKKTDYVLIDTYSTKNFWYASVIARLCQSLKLSYVSILHGGELPNRLKTSPKASNRLFNKAYLNVAPSLYLKTVFQQAGILNVKYIPNSIDIQKYPFLERKSLKPRLLWVRAFDEIYDPVSAIKTLELLLPDFPEATLCMVGPVKDDSYKECLRYAGRKKLPVKFPGRMEKKEWTDLSRSYDIFLNTTTIDNAPVSVVEAMALGLPVVSTNVGGLSYLISADIDGILVPPQDPERMSQAVKEVLRHPARSVERTRAAREKVEAFDWERVKLLWQDLLK
ncbi:Glycosyltransferase involved in cell wall bisynthesis [Salinimicrobium catena]|uniref:Glycosyltransferase involved in cell wall bisynthesis n=1 Tax=Salinimicrobium catena TaxID=390640 RepID=A0A1H5PIC9_9FLAO|nr:glycosyltransferase family 4 protein [Salinimicrobium catena]SDL87469.1 Glycosyltransferase involved in cell wall bisynthesis [Salinimicrobium catena]SEF13475.1 Glycosyltransferase involved in cell wall bisynthesis [Salinimicrobium catena]